MHPPRAADSHLEYINLALEILFAIANTSKPADDVTLSIHKKLCFPRQLEGEEFICNAAKESRFFSHRDALVSPRSYSSVQ